MGVTESAMHLQLAIRAVQKPNFRCVLFFFAMTLKALVDIISHMELTYARYTVEPRYNEIMDLMKE